MERRLTVDCGRYKAGEVYDWPLGTWTVIARGEGKNLNKISEPIPDPYEGQRVTRGTKHGSKR